MVHATHICITFACTQRSSTIAFSNPCPRNRSHGVKLLIQTHGKNNNKHIFLVHVYMLYEGRHHLLPQCGTPPTRGAGRCARTPPSTIRHHHLRDGHWDARLPSHTPSSHSGPTYHPVTMHTNNQRLVSRMVPPFVLCQPSLQVPSSHAPAPNHSAFCPSP